MASISNKKIFCDDMYQLAYSICLVGRAAARPTRHIEQAIYQSDTRYKESQVSDDPYVQDYRTGYVWVDTCTSAAFLTIPSSFMLVWGSFHKESIILTFSHLSLKKKDGL